MAKRELTLEKCPPLLAELIVRAGGAMKAAALLRTDHPSVYTIARGERTFTDNMQERVKTALAKLDGKAPVKTAGNVRPTDAPKVSALQKPLKKCPPLLKQLIDKYNGVYIDAARALGYTSSAWIISMGNGKRKFDEKAQKMVQAALDGEIVTPTHRGAGKPHPSKKHVSQLAVLIVRNAEFPQLYDIATIMGGEWAWKKRAGGLWIGVLRMAGGNMASFLALASAKGVESFTAFQSRP